MHKPPCLTVYLCRHAPLYEQIFVFAISSKLVLRLLPDGDGDRQQLAYHTGVGDDVRWRVPLFLFFLLRVSQSPYYASRAADGWIDDDDDVRSNESGGTKGWVHTQAATCLFHPFAFV